MSDRPLPNQVAVVDGPDPVWGTFSNMPRGSLRPPLSGLRLVVDPSPLQVHTSQDNATHFQGGT